MPVNFTTFVEGFVGGMQHARPESAYWSSASGAVVEVVEVEVLVVDEVVEVEVEVVDVVVVEVEVEVVVEVVVVE